MNDDFVVPKTGDVKESLWKYFRNHRDVYFVSIRQKDAMFSLGQKFSHKEISNPTTLITRIIIETRNEISSICREDYEKLQECNKELIKKNNVLTNEIGQLKKITSRKT